jgi:hypothetical protein
MNRKTTFKAKLPVFQEKSSITCQEISAEGAMPAQKLEVCTLMRLCYEIRQAERQGKTDHRFPVYAGCDSCHVQGHNLWDPV